MKLDYLIINESKLDATIPNNLIALDRFHEPLRKDRNRDGGGCLVYVSKNLTFKRQQKLESDHFDSSEEEELRARRLVFVKVLVYR